MTQISGVRGAESSGWVFWAAWLMNAAVMSLGAYQHSILGVESDPDAWPLLVVWLATLISMAVVWVRRGERYRIAFESLRSAHAGLHQEKKVAERKGSRLKGKNTALLDKARSVREALTASKNKNLRLARELSMARKEIEAAQLIVGTLSVLLRGSEVTKKKILLERQGTLETANELRRYAEVSIERSLKVVDKQRKRAYLRLMLSVFPYGTLFDSLADGWDLAVTVEDLGQLSEVLTDVTEGRELNGDVAKAVRSVSKAMAKANDKIDDLMSALGPRNKFDPLTLPGRVKEVFGTFVQAEKALDSQALVTKLVKTLPPIDPHPLMRARQNRNDMSRQALAEAAGVSVQTIRRIERYETKNPKQDTVEKLTKVLELSTDELVQQIAKFRPK